MNCKYACYPTIYKLDAEAMARDLQDLEYWRHWYKIPKVKPEGFISVWSILKTVDPIGWSV